MSRAKLPPRPAETQPGTGPQIYKRKGSANWYVKVHVPPTAGRGDTHIERSLRTSNRSEALRRRPVVVGEIKAEIERLRRDTDGSLRHNEARAPKDAAKWAAWWREKVIEAGGNPDTGDVPLGLEEALSHEVEQRLGKPVGEGLDHDGVLGPIYRPGAEIEADRLYGLAMGRLRPVDAGLERYIAERRLKVRYADRCRRAVARLLDWLSRRDGSSDLRSVTKHSAALFVDDLSSGSISTTTVNGYVSSLATYWSWMERRGLATTNPWAGQQRKPAEGEGAKVRAFTDDEAATLLNGETYLTLHDLMRVAALSGMRISEICNLTASDVSDGVFNITDTKTKAGIRRVPIHSDLASIIERRVRGKKPSDHIFEELKAPPGRPKERSAKASERFTAYRRRVEVDDRSGDQRISNVNFHSWRHRFITKALQADIAPHLVSAVVGHEQGRTTMTLKVYDSGPSFEQLKSVVETVRLPAGASPESPQGAKMGADRGRPKANRQS